MRGATTDLEALRTGAPRQRRAYAVLQSLAIFERLAAFRPALAGTLPLPIHTEASDLDVLCEVHDPAAFVAACSPYATRPGFTTEQAPVRGVPSTIVRFAADEFAVELFGQPQPVAQQHGWRHLQIEARVLALAGEAAVATITQWKREGMKTEPAFARWLRLPGDDPYLAVLALEELDDEALRRLMPRAREDA
ncbi:protein of unknown function [Nannocystis exedens]|uniref:DUF4269 domain-containing protein n=1 Tax=Nannocystis exedens TaxID=54 RepID=A0A1I2IPD1_9BACT|nr:DUF4269 domain-containing protein [Nannocystis exedens]PCC74979.1 HIT family protein [Nannocystis exedens]SFF42917.1 protein of unknown function [Nannocystis exedens]